jgi:hypothetical protein
VTKHKQVVYFSWENKDKWGLIWQTLLDILKVFKQSKKDFEISIDYKKQTPTNSQRAYYWAVVVPTVRKRLVSLGNADYSKDVQGLMTDTLLRKQTGFYKVKKTKLKGKEVSFVCYNTTSNAGEKEEVKEFIDACIRWSVEMLDLDIPSAQKMGYRV